MKRPTVRGLCGLALVLSLTQPIKEMIMSKQNLISTFTVSNTPSILVRNAYFDHKNPSAENPFYRIELPGTTSPNFVVHYITANGAVEDSEFYDPEENTLADILNKLRAEWEEMDEEMRTFEIQHDPTDRNSAIMHLSKTRQSLVHKAFLAWELEGVMLVTNNVTPVGRRSKEFLVNKHYTDLNPDQARALAAQLIAAADNADALTTGFNKWAEENDPRAAGDRSEEW